MAHPTAGEKGEGPPIAPANWKWRCGNRPRDMYFYSPEGKVFRSRLELSTYLSSIADPPSMDDFCWRVTAEILSTGVWNKEELSPKPMKAAATTPKTPKVPSSAPKRKPKNAEEEKRGRPKIDTGSNGTAQIPTTPNLYSGVQFSQVEPLAIRAPGSVMSKKVTSVTSRAKAKAKKDKIESPTTHTFREILTEPSSFKWLYSTQSMEKFLEDAAKLTELGQEEISDLRAVLVDRNLQMGNITKYPNPVLRVFVRLLGTEGLGEEPASSLGKVELADMCMKLARRDAP